MRSAVGLGLCTMLCILLAGCVTTNNTTEDHGGSATTTPPASTPPPSSPSPTSPPPTSSPSPTSPPPTSSPPTSPSPTPTPEGTTYTVTIGAERSGSVADYAPTPIEIQVGDSILWDNIDGKSHTATADDGTFDTGNIQAQKQSAAIVFDTAGTFSYGCDYHPAMAGEVRVTA